MNRSIHMEMDGFVLVNKENGVEDDNVSVQSDRSSLCLVDDPSADPGLFGDSEDENETPSNIKSPEPPKEEAILDSDASESGTLAKTEAIEPEPIKEIPKKAVPSLQPKYICQACGVDVAAKADIVWEGYMGANVPAFLFRNAKNTEASAAPRQQQLSTGVFLVQDIKCRSCSAQFGWSYLKAYNQDQKYKEGTTIIQRTLVQRVD